MTKLTYWLRIKTLLRAFMEVIGVVMAVILGILLFMGAGYYFTTPLNEKTVLHPNPSMATDIPVETETTHTLPDYDVTMDASEYDDTGVGEVE